MDGMATFSVKRGNTLVLGLELVSGPLVGATCTAALKGRRPQVGDPVLALFDVAYVDHIDPANLSSNPGWRLTLTDEQTGELLTGTYTCDARIDLADGSTQSTDTLYISIQPAVTEVGDG